MENNTDTLKEAVIKAEIIAETDDYKSSYYLLLRGVRKLLGLSQSEINTEVINRTEELNIEL